MPRRPKLDRAAVLAIRARYETMGETMAQLAEAYGVNTRAVFDVIHFKTHKRIRPTRAGMFPPLATVKAGREALDTLRRLSQAQSGEDNSDD